jgi:hypothetical protein
MRMFSRLSNVLDLVVAAVKLAASIKKERKPSERVFIQAEKPDKREPRSLKRQDRNPTSRRDL